MISPINKMMPQRRVVTTIVVGYALGFVLWRLLVASPLYGRSWALQLSEIFGFWAFVPLPFLLAAALIWRSRWLLVAFLLVPLLWFARDYGELFVPSPAAVARASVEGTTLRVMTFNTLYLYSLHAQFSEFVEKEQPDLIVLQETNPVFFRKLAELDNVWPYQEYHVVRVTGRVAMLSKFPILSVESDDEWLGCHCVQTLINWHGKVIRVIAVHIRAPSFGPRIAGRQRSISKFDNSHQALSYDALVPLIENSPEPVVVLGDFNTNERQAGYKRLYNAGLKDAHEEAGWGLGLTYPAPFSNIGWLPFSLLRIDHVFYDEQWRALQTETASLMGSDHQLLIADLKWVGVE